MCQLNGMHKLLSLPILLESSLTTDTKKKVVVFEFLDLFWKKACFSNVDADLELNWSQGPVVLGSLRRVVVQKSMSDL